MSSYQVARNELELRAQVTSLLLKHFGPTRVVLNSLNDANAALILDGFVQAADEIIEIVRKYEGGTEYEQ